MNKKYTIIQKTLLVSSLMIMSLIGVVFALPATPVQADDGFSAADAQRAEGWCKSAGYYTTGNLTLGDPDYDSLYQACANGFLNPTSSNFCDSLSGNKKTACKKAQQANARGVSGAPSPVGGASGTRSCDRVLTFPTWYRGLSTGANCDITKFEFPKSIYVIALNIVEIIIQLVAYACVAFIMYGGFMYITGAGSADKISAGKASILNAIVGLVISMLSVVIVNVIVVNLTGGASAGGNYGVPQLGAEGILSGILTTVYWVGGIAAVVVIIVAGIMYATSEGDSGKIQRAKNAILYSVIGLVVIALAFTITHFIIGRIA